MFGCTGVLPLQLLLQKYLPTRGDRCPFPSRGREHCAREWRNLPWGFLTFHNLPGLDLRCVLVPTHSSFRFQGLKLVKTNATCQPLWWHSLWQSWSTSSRSGISVSLTRRMSTWEKLREVVFREIGGYLRKQLVLFQIGGFVRPCWGSLQKQHRARSPSWYDQGTPDEVFTCCHTFSPDFAWFNLISPDFLTHHTSSGSLSVPDFTRSCTVTWFYLLMTPDIFSSHLVSLIMMSPQLPAAAGHLFAQRSAEKHHLHIL